MKGLKFFGIILFGLIILTPKTNAIQIHKVEGRLDSPQQITGYFFSNPDSVRVGTVIALTLGDYYATGGPVSENPCTVRVWKGDSIVRWEIWSNNYSIAPDLYEYFLSFFVYNLEDAMLPGALRYLTLTNSENKRSTVIFANSGRPQHDGGLFTIGADSTLNPILGDTFSVLFWTTVPNPNQIFYNRFQTIVTDSFGPYAVSIYGGSPLTLDTSAVRWDFVMDKPYFWTNLGVEKITNSTFRSIVQNDSLFGSPYTAKITFQGPDTWTTTFTNTVGDRLFTPLVADTHNFGHIFTAGTYTVTDSLWDNRGDLKNVWTGNIEIIRPPAGWSQLTDVPEGSGKRCKAGTDACADAYNRIWITKGGTLENYIWTPDLTGGGTWTTASLLPAGQKGKTKKGASLIYASGKIYYKEGYGPGFWCKDTSANAAWTGLTDYTIDGKSIKAGTSLAWDNGDLIYMTVGSKSQDKNPVVAMYSISGNSWTNEVLPEGLVPKKKFKEGASIVYTPDGFFASVGHTSELLKRDLSGVWTKATNIPITKKFSGDIAYNPIDNYIYTNEGKNVANFNRYPIAGGAWQNLTAWPVGREAKTPKECALTCSDGIIYGLKGKNTRGFWEYVPTSSLANITNPNHPEKGIQSDVSKIKIDNRIPTIMNASQVKSYVGNYRIYRADGREVKSQDLRQGVYFLQSKTIESKTYKVIITK